MRCSVCHGEGWVCENHPGQAWLGGDSTCCGGAGMPCVCNSEALVPPGFVIEFGHDFGNMPDETIN